MKSLLADLPGSVWIFLSLGLPIWGGNNSHYVLGAPSGEMLSCNGYCVVAQKSCRHYQHQEQ
jgi:hypothetical protein